MTKFMKINKLSAEEFDKFLKENDIDNVDQLYLSENSDLQIIVKSEIFEKNELKLEQQQFELEQKQQQFELEKKQLQLELEKKQKQNKEIKNNNKEIQVINEFKPEAWNLISLVIENLGIGDNVGVNLYIKTLKLHFFDEFKKLRELIWAANEFKDVKSITTYQQLIKYNNKTLNIDLWLPHIANDNREFVSNQWNQKVCIFISKYNI